MKILLLEDDIILADLLKEYLEKQFYSVTHLYSGEEALEKLFFNKYDLLIFDINVPDINGLKVFENFSNEGFNTPIIFISASTDFKEFEKAYKIGANDFLRKPFKLEELKLRIEYIQKNLLSSKFFILNENIKFDFYNMCLEKKGKKIKLPKKEAEIIKYFLTNSNRIISINELIVNIWDYSSTPSIATIRTYIKNIRKNLEYDFLETAKGLGYIFKI